MNVRFRAQRAASRRHGDSGRKQARFRWLAGAVTLVTLMAMVPQVAVAERAAAPGEPPQSRQRLVLNDVHTDSVDIQYTSGQLVLQTRVGSPPYQFHAPHEVIFQLKDTDTSRLQVPDSAPYAFLGDAGTTIWLAPQQQDYSLLFAGWDTESIRPGVLRDDALDLKLVDVAGPGRVEVFQTDPVGLPIRIFSSTDAAFTTLRQPVASHAHANWVFSALGRYQLTFQATATAVDGTTLRSAPMTYTWYVGGTEASDVVGEPTSTTLSASPDSPTAGDPVTLAASVSPPAASGWVEFRNGPVSIGHAAVEAGAASLTTKALAIGSHTLTARYVPTYTNDFVSSTSAPVTVEVGGTGTPTTPPTSTPTSPSPAPSVSPSTGSPTGAPSTAAPTPVGTTPSASSSCVPATRAVTSNAVILDDGHVDYAARLVGGRLESRIKDGTVAGRTAWRDPADVVFHLRPAAAGTVPANGFSFLGAPGSKIWQIPQTQRAGIPWLGWNTEEITASQVSGAVTWSLGKVDGPGRFAIYLLDAFGQPQIVFNSGDGLPDRHQIPLGTHAHGNWAFTAEGVYRLSFTYTATLAGGRQVSDTAVVTVAVGSADPKPLATRRATTTTVPCDGSRLALTGTPLVSVVALAAGLIAVGVLVVVVARRRRRTG